MASPARVHDSYPLCPFCGVRIGVYEPLWHVAPAVGGERTSWLRLSADGRLPDALDGTLWHAECAEQHGVPGG